MPEYGPLAIGPVIDRLTAQVSALRFVGGAADLEAAQRERAPATPAAYVLLSNDRPGSVTTSTQRFRQQVTGAIGVITAVRDYRVSERGAGAADDIESILAAQRAALLGWIHPQSNRTPMRLGGQGRLLSYRNAVVWWQDIYQADYTITNV